MNCRWCSENKVHKEDCPSDDKLTGQVKANKGEWVESNETVSKG